MAGHPHLSVQALTKYIKRKFDADPHLRNVFVKGELSNVKSHPSGHIYFTLKDENSRIQSAMFRSSASSLKFTPENGMNVLITGDVTVFETSGNYQLYVQSMQPDGIGALYLALRHPEVFGAARRACIQARIIGENDRSPTAHSHRSSDQSALPKLR